MIDTTEATLCVLTEVAGERRRQTEKWGDDSSKDHPDGTGRPGDVPKANLAKLQTDAAAVEHRVTWRLILAEEVAEAFAESDPAKLRAELIQVAAVAVKWIEAIERRLRAEP